MENKLEKVLDNEATTNIPKKSVGDRWAAFFDRNYALFFAPILVCAVYFMALFQNGVYPFGNEYTVASYDLSAQICPFIEHIFDVLQGKSTLTYSYAIVGGADVTGTFLYFFLSPFSFLFLIFGDGKVAHAAGIVMVCKLMATSVAGTWFAKKLFKNIPDYLCIVVGVVYAYCGYMFVANTYINWVDFLIYLPFCVAAFAHFVKTGKFLPFSILMACCIYTCFSIACFSMLAVFPCLIGYGLLCVEKERKNKFIAYLCLAFVVAVLLALPVLLPALSAYTQSARGGDTGLLHELWKGFKDKTVANPTNFDSSWYIEDFSTNMYTKWTYILSDSIFVILTLVWFYRNGFASPFAKFMLLAGALTLLPTVVDESMILLNMGSYMSYALRFGFLNALYFLGGACLALDGLCYNPKCAYDGTPLFELLSQTAQETQQNENEEDRYALNTENPLKTNENTIAKNQLFSLVIITIGVIVAAFLFVFISGENYKDEDFWGIFFEDSETLSAISGFSAKFAHSLGGLEVIVVLFICVALVVAVGCFFVGEKKISPRLLSYILIVVVGIQVLFYNNQLVVGNTSTQHQRLGSYGQLAQQLNAMDDSYFRVKDYGELTKSNGSTVRSDMWTANAPFTGGTNSFSVFSSVIDKNNFVMMNLFGYLGNGKNSFKSTHDTDGPASEGNRSDEFGDSFLGYKYFIVPHKQRSNVEEREYVKAVMVKDENGNETPMQVQNGDNERYYFYVYENTIVFPSGYRVNSGDFRFPVENSGSDSNRKKNQAALYEFLRGENLDEFTGTGFVTPQSAKELSEYLWSKAADVEVGAGKITAKVSNATAGECLLLNFVASKGYTVTVNGKKATLIDNDLKFLTVALEEGDNVVEFTYASPYIKYAAIGALTSLVTLCAVAFVVKKTKLVDWSAPVIAWAGIILAAGVIAFFMLYPATACVIKLLKVIIP